MFTAGLQRRSLFSVLSHHLLSMAASPREGGSGCLDREPSEMQLKAAVQAFEARLQLLQKRQTCPGDGCDCHAISSQVQELLASFAAILHNKDDAAAPCSCTATEAATKETEQQQHLCAQVQMLKELNISSVLTRGLSLLLSGRHSTEAICSLAEAFNR